MTTSLEGWPTKAKEVPSPHGVGLAPLDTNPVFQSLGGTEKSRNKTTDIEKTVKSRKKNH